MSRRFTLVPSNALLLDNFPNALWAYSLRKLRLGYTGSCIRVRRSIDNAEMNIGFVNNILDADILLSFVGSGNGFVTTRYDQSGNGNHQTQTSASLQFRIVNAGVLDVIGGLPVVRTTAANTTQHGNIPVSTLQSLPITLIEVTHQYALPSGGVSFTLCGSGSGANFTGRYEQARLATTLNTIRRNTAGADFQTSPYAQSKNIQSSIYGASNFFQRVNGTNSSTVSYAGTQYNSASNFRNGCGQDAIYNGNIAYLESVAWLADQTSNIAAIEANQNNYYGVF